MFLSSRSKIATVYLTIIFLSSCAKVISRQSANVGQIAEDEISATAVSYEKLLPPQDVEIVNNKTGTEKHLTLKWPAVSGARGYRIYYVVYPTCQYKSGSLPAKDYKLLIDVPAKEQQGFVTWKHEIPHIPLRRYSYRISCVNDWEESALSDAVDGWRVPLDEEEALRDMDYTMHFAQTSVPNFGRQGQESIISGRALGNYYYASKMTKVMSKFENYADFETILNGNPTIKINFFPLGVRMNGDISASGLYNAVVTYNNLVCVVGGYTRKGSIKIVYHHPVKGIMEREYDYDQMHSLLKTVAYDEQDVKPRPPAAEWDESSPEYIQAMHKAAELSAAS